MNCKDCIHAGKLNNFMYFCSKLGYSVVQNRVNKTRSERNGKKTVYVEVCRAEELGKGKFKMK